MLRYDMVMHALAAGKHVINANPFAPDIAGAKAMREAQQAAGVVGMIEAQFQWLPQFRQMKAMIADGALGDLIGVELRCHFPLIRDGDALFPFVTGRALRPTTTGSAWRGRARARCARQAETT